MYSYDRNYGFFHIKYKTGFIVMARVRPAHRFRNIAHAAAETFIESGYRKCKMADVADRMNIAPGTLYLYVKSKEALYDVALRYTLSVAHGHHFPTPEVLPLKSANFQKTIDEVRQHVGSDQEKMKLYHVDLQRIPTNPRQEFITLFGEVYDLYARWQMAIKLLNNTTDHPELVELWTHKSRRALYDKVYRYLITRMRQEVIRPLMEPNAATLMLVNTLSNFTCRLDPLTRAVEFDRDQGRTMALDLLCSAYLHPQHKHNK